MTARPTAPDSTSETTPDVPDAAAVPDVAAELALEQAHVDRVYAELEKASRRAADVEADGLARGRTSRTGDVRDEEMTGLFERDALVYAAARRRSMIDKQYEGLVFGRLDLGTEQSTAAEREVRYIGRLGVRDDDYEPLVVDWRAPAASAFYRATPVTPAELAFAAILPATCVPCPFLSIQSLPGSPGTKFNPPFGRRSKWSGIQPVSVTAHLMGRWKKVAHDRLR